MLKSLAVALAAGSFGLVGTGSAQAQCACQPAAPVTAAVAPTAAAPAVASRSYRSYSYQPGTQAYQSYRAPMTRGFSSTPSFDAGRKIRGF